jgi:hypothetical protein
MSEISTVRDLNEVKAERLIERCDKYDSCKLKEDIKMNYGFSAAFCPEECKIVRDYMDKKGLKKIEIADDNDGIVSEQAWRRSKANKKIA